MPVWQRCEKMTPTRARQLTQANYEARHGQIETREGPAPFTAGDYLAVDAQGEYPIRCATIEQRYTQLTPPDSEGWATYRSTEIREACQQFQAFTTDCGAIGLAGDYLMRGSDRRTWPCAKAKFEREYRVVSRMTLARHNVLFIGVSTRRELEYARRLGKHMTFLEEPKEEEHTHGDE